MTLHPVDDNGNVNCFDKIFELKKAKCEETNCSRKCKFIIKGQNRDKYYCNYHFRLGRKHGIIATSHSWLQMFSFRYELAKLLVLLGFVKESKNA